METLISFRIIFKRQQLPWRCSRNLTKQLVSHICTRRGNMEEHYYTMMCVPSFRIPLGARGSCSLVQYSSHGGLWTSSVSTTCCLIRHEFSGPPTGLLNQNLGVGVRNLRLLKMKLRNFAFIVFMWLHFSVFGNTVSTMSLGKSCSMAELYHGAFFHDGMF